MNFNLSLTVSFTVSSNTEGLYAEYSDMNLDQKQRLLDVSEQIEETGKHLSNGYRIAVETEELGSKMLQDLYAQRETIQSSLHRVCFQVLAQLIYFSKEY